MDNAPGTSRGPDSAPMAQSPGANNNNGDKSNSNGNRSSDNNDCDNGPALILSQLCVNGLAQRAGAWKVKGGSWTDEITTTRASGTHYITCEGHHHGTPCVGPWSRRLRQTAVSGLHCVFGGWVLYDGKTVRNIEPSINDGEDIAINPRHMVRLRQLWADHILAQIGEQCPDEKTVISPLPVELTSIAQVHAMLNTFIAKSTAQVAAENEATGKTKKLGRGSGGSNGIAPGGQVLKRDTRDRDTALREDRSDLELGGLWKRGDVDPWMPLPGWSALVSRDGRWRPGYHLNMLVANWATVVDYGLTRPVYRERQLSWIRATEQLWVDPPLDITGDYLHSIRQDVTTMARKELKRGGALEPEEYKPDDFATADSREVALQDRAGPSMAWHTLEQGLHTPRGLVVATLICALNDILDYERDVLAGETNNIARGLTSKHQVVDLAAWTLEAALWAMANKDYDVIDTIFGTFPIYTVMWRYNTPKMARYRAVSIRSHIPHTPPELEDVSEIVRAGAHDVLCKLVTYEDLYRAVEEQARGLYAGCSCDTTPVGHDAADLLVQAFDDKGNDEAEHQLSVSVVALNNGAQSGDVRCDCGLDLLTFESFVRFLHPDVGIVARLHYRTEITKEGNTVTE